MNHLPLELWRLVIQTHRSDESLVFLWTVLRNVSTSFRQLVEEWVARQFFRHTLILPRFALQHASASFDFHSECPFKLISPSDKSRAIFSLFPEISDAMLRRRRAERWALALECKVVGREAPDTKMAVLDPSDPDTVLRSTDGEDTVLFPPTFIVLKRLTNDTELIDPVIDVASSELSIDWPGTLTRLVREEKLRRDLHRKWRAEVQAEKAALRAQSGSRVGRMALAAHLSSPKDDSARRARGTRIRLQLKEQGRESDVTQMFSSGLAVGVMKFNGFEGVELLSQQTNTWLFEYDI